MIKLINGDCLDVMKEIPDGSIDMILCDLPYGITQNSWDLVIPFEPLWEHYKRLIKKNGAIVLFASQQFTSALIMSNIEMFKYCWVWNKKLATGHLNAKKQPLRATEDIVVFYKQQSTYNPQKITGYKRRIYKGIRKHRGDGLTAYGKADKETLYDSEDRYPINIIEFSNATHAGKSHPTQKPVELMEYLIKTYSNEGETVLDNCAESFTTGVACKLQNRNFIGIEQDEKYFEIGVKRMNETHNLMAV